MKLLPDGSDSQGGGVTLVAKGWGLGGIQGPEEPMVEWMNVSVSCKSCNIQNFSFHTPSFIVHLH